MGDFHCLSNLAYKEQEMNQSRRKYVTRASSFNAAAWRHSFIFSSQVDDAEMLLLQRMSLPPHLNIWKRRALRNIIRNGMFACVRLPSGKDWTVSVCEGFSWTVCFVLLYVYTFYSNRINQLASGSTGSATQTLFCFQMYSRLYRRIRSTDV